MYVTRYKSFSDLKPLKVGWEELATEGPHTPFLSWEWSKSWWESFSEGRELYILVVREELIKEANGEDRVLAIAPWHLEKDQARGRRIKFLGSGFACADYMGLLCRPAYALQSCQALSRWLTIANEATDQVEDRWDFLSFDGVADSNAVMAELSSMLQSEGHLYETDGGSNCWRTDLRDDWDGFLNSLSRKSYRKKLRSLKKKYIDSVRTSFEMVTSSVQFEEVYAQFVELHQKRRKSLGQPGCFACPEFAAFLGQASRELFETGCLVLTRLKIDGQLAACSLGIRDHRIHYMYQTGLNPDLTQSNPGWLMNIHNVLLGQELGLQAIDYLRGDEPYKADMGAQEVQMKKYRIVGQRPESKIRNQAWNLRTTLKSGLSVISSLLPHSDDG